MERHPDVELVRSDRVHRGQIFDVRRETVRLPSGLEQTIDAIDHPGAVAVVARDARGRLLVVRQYRHATGRWLVEIPAGRLEAGEDPRTAAERELEEETGYRAERVELMREFFPAPGFCSERMTLFAAHGCTRLPGGGRPSDDDEELEVDWIDPREVLAERAQGDAKTLIAAHWALAHALEPDGGD